MLGPQLVLGISSRSPSLRFRYLNVSQVESAFNLLGCEMDWSVRAASRPSCPLNENLLWGISSRLSELGNDRSIQVSESYMFLGSQKAYSGSILNIGATKTDVEKLLARSTIKPQEAGIILEYCQRRVLPSFGGSRPVQELDLRWLRTIQSNFTLERYNFPCCPCRRT